MAIKVIWTTSMVLLLSSWPVSGNFLAQDPHPEAAAVRRLRKALAGALGDRHRVAEMRVGGLEDALRSTFAALPKNQRGAVDGAAARYALHRLFVQRHGWQMVGLDPAGEAWAAASPAAALGDRVPDHVRELFEDRLEAAGFDLHELALLAAALEQLVHAEAVQRLQATYAALNFTGRILTAAEATEAIDTYMASFIIGTNALALTPAAIEEHKANIDYQYPSWPETLKFLRQAQDDVAPNVESFEFQQVEEVVEEIGERYGRWQQTECHALKNQLLQMEERPGSGRVRLADFYGGTLRGDQWQFSESTAYLRHLGALDDSDPSALRVIIPNYINGPSNCVASGGYYSVCCIDECEALMSSLESQLAAPRAPASDILALVAAMPSATVPAGRTLPDSLVQRLHDVAAHHDGVVPLHGRLFAQWLHHAYPRECPYPHVSGTTNPRSAEDWEVLMGLEASATNEEMTQHIESARNWPRSAEPCEDGECAPQWSPEEELVSIHAAPTPARRAADGQWPHLVRTGAWQAGHGQSRHVFRSAALFGALFAAALGLVGTLRAVASALEGSAKGPAKHFV